MDIPVVKLQGTISRGVVRVFVDDDGDLIFEMSNGELIDVGRVLGGEGAAGIGIASIQQTTTSTENNGINIVTVTLTSGEQVNFEVRNGSQGEQGLTGPAGPKGDRGDGGTFVWSLLDNGDFTNPVNLSGSSNTITRWNVGTNGSVAVKDGCIGITNSSASSRIIFMQQLPYNHVGEEVTIAVCDDNGEIHHSSAVVPAVASTETYFNVVNFGGNDDKDHTCRLSLTSDGELRFQIVVKASSVLNVRWAAMYKGNLTLDALKTYTPKGYNVELLNCGGYATAESLNESTDSSQAAITAVQTAANNAQTAAATAQSTANTAMSNASAAQTSADNAQTTANRKIEIKKIWENAKPTSDFAAQTITLDLSDADMVMIKFKAQASSTSTTRNIAFGFIGEQVPLVGYLNLGSGSNSAEFSYRLATVSTVGVVFAAGYKKSTGSNATGEAKPERSTPIEIYTIKGVQK